MDEDDYEDDEENEDQNQDEDKADNGDENEGEDVFPARILVTMAHLFASYKVPFLISTVLKLVFSRRVRELSAG